jgi:hypothetical protein
LRPIEEKRILPMALAFLLLLITAFSAQGLQSFDPTYTDSQYSQEYGSTGAYSSTVPDGAPRPVAPSSAQDLRLSIPEEETASYQTPPSKEISQSIIPASSAAVSGAASANRLSSQPQTTQYFGGNYPTEDYPAQSMIVFPKGRASTNKLYISDVPKTVAGCRLNGWLPMWMQTFSSAPLWFYEWYPSSSLSVNYLGYAGAGWQKRWFNGDTPGWHILQYYSRGWSNYIYIYVYGQRSGQWTDLGPYAGPVSSKPSYKGTASVTMSSNWLRGYDIYVDGSYTGTEGTGSDILDGIYNFRVPGDMEHTIVLMKNGQSYPEAGTFLSGASYRFTI